MVPMPPPISRTRASRSSAGGTLATIPRSLASRPFLPFYSSVFRAARGLNVFSHTTERQQPATEGMVFARSGSFTGVTRWRTTRFFESNGNDDARQQRDCRDKQNSGVETEDISGETRKHGACRVA